MVAEAHIVRFVRSIEGMSWVNSAYIEEIYVLAGLFLVKLVNLVLSALEMSEKGPPPCVHVLRRKGTVVK